MGVTGARCACPRSDMGNLQEACDKQKFLLPDKTPDFPIIVSVMREIAGAVSHLHHRGIIHG